MAQLKVDSLSVTISKDKISKETVVQVLHLNLVKMIKKGRIHETIEDSKMALRSQPSQTTTTQEEKIDLTHSKITMETEKVSTTVTISQEADTECMIDPIISRSIINLDFHLT